MPLATELLRPIRAKLSYDGLNEWLDEFERNARWVSPASSGINIEEVFHLGWFEAEFHRLSQHISPVGRNDGPETPWANACSVENCLVCLLEGLRAVIFDHDVADLTPLRRWANSTTDHDCILTFNYDTLAEQSLIAEGKQWNHGTARAGDAGVPVFKLHGSIDWVVDSRGNPYPQFDLLYDKRNLNRTGERVGHVEEDFLLWHCNTRAQLRSIIEDDDVQRDTYRSIGIAGLGMYKVLHQVPGLGVVWTNAMQSLYQADLAVVVGFSMSDFDTMAKMQFADVARARHGEGRPLPVLVIDPSSDSAARERFERVFRYVQFIKQKHEDFDWSSILSR